MKNQLKKGWLVGCVGGVLALALWASPALGQSQGSSVTETGGANPSRTDITHSTVVVTAIDKSGRLLTVKKPSGEKQTIRVPEDVQAFDTLKVGDKIDVDYMESVALSVLPPGSKPSMTERTATIPGAKGREVTLSAEVVSVDVPNNKVTFKGPKGHLTTVTVQSPAVQARLPHLKPGQVVQLTYTEATAADIRMAK